VHVPFCEAKCSYCDFYSVARGDAPRHRYVDALRAEATRRTPRGFQAETVFIGGGTPTALSDADFAQMLEIVRDVAGGAGAAEWTVECHPGSLTPEKAQLLAKYGVTRASIGVQSFDDAILRSVGRVHTADEAREAVGIARAAGIPQVSIDLLFAIPGQGFETFERDLRHAIELETDHVSAYALLYEDGTTLTRMRSEGRVQPESEDNELTMLRLARDTLGVAGYAAYEISNFARPGAECRHNLNYWRNGSYLGLGPSAVSYMEGVRRTTVASWRDWEREVLAGDDPMSAREALSGPRAAGEEIMLRLRLAEGAPLREVGARWGVSLDSCLEPLIRRLEGAGLVTCDADGALRLTDAGLPVADGVISEILAACSEVAGSAHAR